MKKASLSAIFFLMCLGLSAQILDSMLFLSHEKIPTLIALGTDWQTSPKIHIYDYKKYPKHAIFLNNVLHVKVQFKDFKHLVSDPKKRQYVPFFIFDLSEKPLVIAEKNYYWAVRVEDYSFKDSPESLANLMGKVMDLVGENPDFSQSAGVLVIAEGGTNNYNMAKLKPLLEKSGHTVCALKEIYRLFEVGK